MEDISNISVTENKEKIAIVVVGYNRIDAIHRLTNSLVAASYPTEDIPLVYCIDASGNEQLYDFVRHVEWPHGKKYVNIQKERLGLRKHIYVCGDMSKYFKGVIILEDDIIVSPDFYRYTYYAVNKYYNDERVAGIALFADQTNGYAQGIPNYRLKDGSDGYMLQEVCTSGECFTDKMWAGFRKWKDENGDKDPTPYPMPETIKHWTHAWSKYYNMYILDNNYFFLSPYNSITTNGGDAGVHSTVDLNYLHSDMMWGIKKEYEFNDFDDCIKYDIYGSFIGASKYLGIKEEELCSDFYGNKSNLKLEKRFLLSPYKLPYKIEKSFGLILEPMETNLMYGIKGKDIFLYDTTIPTRSKTDKQLTLHQLSYHVRGTSYKILLLYSLKKLYLGIKGKFIRK